MAAFASRLVTPERVVFEEEVQAVFLRTDVGEAAFLPGHTPLIGAITPGSARFQREDDSEVLTAVHGGFVQVEGDAVIVLTPVAELAEEIDVERARRALEAAEQRIAELGGSRAGAEDAEDDPSRGELASAEAAKRRAEVRLEVAGAAELARP
jgi:F-type H+-transporting ATPase subunit epsilon